MSAPDGTGAKSFTHWGVVLGHAGPVWSRRGFLRRSVLGAGGLWLGGAALVACGDDDTTGEPDAAVTDEPEDTSAEEEPRPFPLAIAAGLDTSPLLAGVDEGFYDARGLAVEPNIFFSGVELVNSLVSGESLVTVIGTAVFYSSVLEGAPMRIIALEHGDATAEFYSTAYMIAAPDAGVGPGEYEQLAGKTIGTPLGTDGESAMRALLAQSGLTGDDVEAVQVAPPDMATALGQGQVDAVIFVEPWSTLVESQVEGAVRVNQEVAPIYGPGIIVTTEDALQSNRELLVDFLAASAESHQWARQNLTGGLLEVNGRWTEIPEDVAREALPRISFDMRLSTLVVDRLANETVPTLVEIGALAEPVAAEDTIDTSLMREVQESFPEFFDDLPEIPEQFQL